jgi:hypothetical protein
MIILSFNYLVDIRSEDWLNLFRKHINGKLFTVYIYSATRWKLVLTNYTSSSSSNQLLFNNSRNKCGFKMNLILSNVGIDQNAEMIRTMLNRAAAFDTQLMMVHLFATSKRQGLKNRITKNTCQRD